MSRTALIMALLILGVSWGFTIPLTKVAVSEGAQPIAMIFWQFVIGTVLLGSIVAWRGLKLRPNRTNVIYMAGIALIGTLLPNSASFVSTWHLPAGVVALNIAAVPMFAMLIAAAIGIERLEFMRVLGVVAGACAVLLLIGPEASLPDPSKSIFVLVALIAPFCYGLEASYIATRAPAGIDAIETLFGASIIGALISGPIAYFSGSWIDMPGAWGPPQHALVVASMLHALSYAGYIWLVGVAGPVFSAQSAYVVTATAFLASMIFLGEQYSGWVWAAFGLMFIGLLLVQPRKTLTPDPV